MPSKIQLDENLWFLFICLQKSDYKTIDFNAVGEATNLNPPAARMRYTRLRRQIEGGTLVGTHGTLFVKAAEKTPETAKRRRLSSGPGQEQIGGLAVADVGGTRTETPKKIKLERSSSMDEYETASEDSDSEDDIPLAKQRTANLNRLVHVNQDSPDAKARETQSANKVIPGDLLIQSSLGGFYFEHPHLARLTAPQHVHGQVGGKAVLGSGKMAREHGEVDTDMSIP